MNSLMALSQNYWFMPEFFSGNLYKSRFSPPPTPSRPLEKLFQNSLQENKEFVEVLRRNQPD